MKILATTVPGLEEQAIQEVEELISIRAEKVWGGALLLECSERDIFLLNYRAKLLSRVVVLLALEEFESLSDIYRIARGLDYAEYISEGQSFAVRCKRQGEHDFTSMDVNSIVGKAVLDSHPGEIKVNLNAPDVIVRCYVRGNRFMLGIDTTGEKALYKRGYRVYNHPASLNPAIAHAMVRLSGFSEKDTFIDPFCGGGTICIEAVHRLFSVPNFFRDDYAFWRLKFLPIQEFVEIKREIDSRVKIGKARVYGCELFEKHIRGARENARSARVEVEFFKCDATRVNLNYDRIVSNLPFGLRIGKKKLVHKLYQDFIENLNKSDFKTCVLLLEDYSQFSYTKRISILYGNLPANIIIIG